MEHRISLFTPSITNLPRPRSFYADGLGWTPSALSNENVASCQCGGVVFGLYRHTALAADYALDSDAGDGFWSRYSGYFAAPNGSLQAKLR